MHYGLPDGINLARFQNRNGPTNVPPWSAISVPPSPIDLGNGFSESTLIAAISMRAQGSLEEARKGE